MSAQLLMVRDVWTDGETIGSIACGPRKWSTIERAWIPSSATPGGSKGLSCIPCGEYRIEPHDTEAHPKVWALVNKDLDVYHWPHEVPAARRAFARTVCLIHAANWAHELRGCIAPGKSRSYDAASGRWRISQSRDALNELRSVLGSAVGATVVISDGRKL